MFFVLKCCLDCVFILVIYRLLCILSAGTRTIIKAATTGGKTIDETTMETTTVAERAIRRTAIVIMTTVEEETIEGETRTIVAEVVEALHLVDPHPPSGTATHHHNSDRQPHGEPHPATTTLTALNGSWHGRGNGSKGRRTGESQGRDPQGRRGDHTAPVTRRTDGHAVHTREGKSDHAVLMTKGINVHAVHGTGRTDAHAAHETRRKGDHAAEIVRTGTMSTMDRLATNAVTKTRRTNTGTRMGSGGRRNHTNTKTVTKTADNDVACKGLLLPWYTVMSTCCSFGRNWVWCRAVCDWNDWHLHWKILVALPEWAGQMYFSC